MTFDEFIQDALLRYSVYGGARSHVVEPSFETLYVRLGRRIVEKVLYQPVLDIATVSVDEKYRGRGVFTGFLDRVRDRYPSLPIYVENVMEARFQKYLERYGFTIVEPRLDPPCYFLPARKHVGTT